jgi:hypothetical protein
MIIYHNHHIIPRHMGGTDDPSNLIKVNIALHAFLHKLLWEEHGKWEDKIAWQMLSGQISSAEASNEARRLANLGNKNFEGKTHSNEYKKELSKMMKEKRKKFPKMGNHKPHKEETKEKIKMASMGNMNGKISGYKLDDDFKEKKRKYMSDPNNNPAKRADVREKLRKAALLREERKRNKKEGK